jgi:hypothetical protein
MVLLQHTLPDGGSHYDWMIDVPPPAPLRRRRGPTEPLDPDARDLATFRVDVRIDQSRIDEFLATALPNHRRRYLTYQGPLSDGRGHVRRVAKGIVTRWDPQSDGSIDIRGTFGPRDHRIYHGTPDRTNPTRWYFTILPTQHRPGASPTLSTLDTHLADINHRQ